MSSEIAQYYKEEDQKQMSSNSFLRKRQNRLSAEKTSGFIQERSEKRNLRMCKKILGHVQGRSDERIAQMLRREEEKTVSKSHHQVTKVSDVFDMNDFNNALEDIFELHQEDACHEVNCDVCDVKMKLSEVGFTDDSGIALCLGCAFNVKANRELIVEVEEKKTLHASDGVRRCHCCSVPEYDLIPGRGSELLCADCMEDIYPSQEEGSWMVTCQQEEEDLIIDEDGNVVTLAQQWLSNRRRNNYIDISNGYISSDVIDVCLNCKYNAVCDGVNICEECDTIQDETLKITCDSCENVRFVGWYEDCDECMYCINVYNNRD
jgi:hypothetical protein